MPWLQQLGLLRANLLSLGTRRLVALGVAAAFVVALVSTAAFYGSRPETEPLYVGLSQADVARIGAVLRDSGVPYDVSSDGTKVLVRRAQAPHARMLLAERGLPAGTSAGYELFDKLGPLGLTSFMQDVTRTRALEGELARSIQTMKGIVSARVHIVAPPSSTFRRSQQPTSASVVVRLEGPRPESVAQAIRHLVSAGVPGLSPESVSVMSTDGSIIAAGGDASLLGSARLIELEKAVSREAQENIRRTLAPYLGIENFEVSVSARLNLDKRNQSEQTYDPGQRAERSTRTVKEQGASQNNGSRQAVTVEQNVPTEQVASGGGDQSRKSNERRETVINYELSQRVLSTVSEGHRIEQLQVSLVVNRKRFPSTAAGSEVESRLKEIESIAAAAAGLDVKRGDKISVAAVEFQNPPSEPPGKTGFLERLALSLDTVIISVTAIAVVLILVWLGLLPSVRTIMASRTDAVPVGTSRANEPTMISGPAAAEIAMTPLDIADAGSLLPAAKPDPLQAKLAGLIEDNEKAVAEILKQWIKA